MGLIELIMTFCVAAQMNVCEEQHLQFAFSGSLRQCAMGAQPYIARWIGEHPKWTVVRWRCENPAQQQERS